MKHFLREEEMERQEENYRDFCDNFSMGGKVWINKDFLNKEIVNCGHELAQREKLALLTMAENTCFECASLSKGSIIDYLEYFENVPLSVFRTKKSAGESFSKEVRDRILRSGLAVEFVTKYEDYSACKSLNSNLKSVLSNITPTDLTTDDGSRLYELKYELSELKNRRVGTKNYNVIGIQKSRCSMIQAPKGITFFEGDLPQADLRNAFNLLLKTKDTEEIFKSEDDAYKAFAKLVAKMNNKVFNEQDFLENRQDYKAVTLGPIYGKVQSENPVQKEYVDSINKVINEIPKYKKFKENINIKKEEGINIYSTSYFGFKQFVEASNHGYAGRGDVLNSALNSPIQTATSELIILITNSICNQLKSLGLKQNEDFGILVIRYDEPIFWIKDELVDDYSWVFKDHEEIIIDDFTPIYLKFEASKKYHVVSDEMNERYKMCCERNINKINTKKKSFKSSVDNYIPVKGALVLYLGLHKTDNFYIFTLYNKDKECRSFKVDSSNLTDIEILQEVTSRINNFSQNILDNNYDSVVIYNNFISTCLLVDEDRLFIKYVNKEKENLYDAKHVAYVISYLYSKKLGLNTDSFDEELLNSRYDLITPSKTKINKIKLLTNE